MATQNFTLKKGTLDQFIEFAAGDPYYLDFSEGGQSGTISWGMYTVRWENIKNGFKVTYQRPRDIPIIGQISTTVKAFNNRKN